MHVRVLLSRYRTYRECPACCGARLKPEALLWRVGSRTEARRALGRTPAHRPPGATLDERAFAGQPGLVHPRRDAPAARPLPGVLRPAAPARPLDEATALLLAEIRVRLGYLVEVGLGYLTLDRQSRTLSGGEVQRINLTTALGTSLVNTLFVLDEPSIGLHARDVARIVSVLHKLRAAGNTLLVVEHDPQIMRAADRIIDLGPGPGERGGEVVFQGTPARAAALAALAHRGVAAGGAADRAAGGGHFDAGNPCFHASGPRPHRDPGRVRPQLGGHRRRRPAAPLRMRERGQRLGEVHAGGGRALPRRVQAARALHRGPRRAPGDPRARRARRRRARGPVAHRQDHPLEPRELRRGARRGPQAVRGRAGGDRARVYGGDVQLQLRQRALPGLWRKRLRARRDAVPERRVPALPRLRRATLSKRSARREDPPVARERRGHPPRPGAERPFASSTAGPEAGAARASTKPGAARRFARLDGGAGGGSGDGEAGGGHRSIATCWR